MVTTQHNDKRNFVGKNMKISEKAYIAMKKVLYDVIEK